MRFSSSIALFLFFLCGIAPVAVCASEPVSMEVSLPLPSNKAFRFPMAASWSELPIPDRNVNYQYSLQSEKDGVAEYFIFIRALPAQGEPVLKWAEDELSVRKDKGGFNISGPKGVRIGGILWFLVESEKAATDKNKQQIFKVYEYLTKALDDTIIEVTVMMDRDKAASFDVGELYRILSLARVD
jgi:hypothetical protein